MLWPIMCTGPTPAAAQLLGIYAGLVMKVRKLGSQRVCHQWGKGRLRPQHVPSVPAATVLPEVRAGQAFPETKVFIAFVQVNLDSSV